MTTRQLALISLSFASTAPSVGAATEMQPAYQSEVQLAERLGAALFNAERVRAPNEQSEVSAVRKLLPNLCQFQYKPVPVVIDGKSYVYFIAQGSRATDIVIGRHFRVDGTNVVASSTVCSNMGTPPVNTKLATIVHVMSPTPTDFHVYLSLRQPVPIMVVTNGGTWLVDKGKIVLGTGKGG